MGIGAALAMGLVQGFTRNIQAEQTRRQAEDERANAYQEMIAKAVLEGKATQEGINSVQTMINNYKTELDKRPSIGLFGKASDAVTMDMSKIQTALTSADDFKYVIGLDGTRSGKTGAGTFNYRTDVGDFSSQGKNASALAAINTYHFASPQRQLELLNAPVAQINHLGGLIRNHVAAYTNEFNVQQEAGMLVEMDAGVFEAAKNFNALIAKRYAKTKEPQFKDFDIMARGTGDSGDYSTITETGEIFNGFNSADYPDGQRVLATEWRTTPEMLTKLFENYTAQIGGITKQQRTSYLNATLEVMQEYAESNMTFPKNSLGIAGMNQDAAKNLLDSITAKIGSNDPVGMAYVLGAFQTLDSWKPSTNWSWVDQAVSNKMVAARELFGRDAKEKDFQKLIDTTNEIKTVLGADDGSGTGLYEMKRMILEDFKSPAAVSRIQGLLASGGAIFAGLLGMDTTTGLNDSMVSSFSTETNIVTDEYYNANVNEIDPITGEPVKMVSRGYIQSLNDRVEAARKLGMQEGNQLQGESLTDAGARYARFEALRIALAFQMARAADPSGRLSNQDIDQQLTRLGTNTDTVQAMAARIQLVIDDFEIKMARYGGIVDMVGDGSGRATVRSRKYIKGAIALDRLAKKADFTGFADYSRRGALPTSFDPPSEGSMSGQFTTTDGRPVYFAMNPETNVPILNEQGNATYIDSDGTVVTDIVRKAQDSAPVPGPGPLDKRKGEVPDPPKPPQPVTGGEPIDPSTVTMVPGTNAITGFRLRDNETKEELPGKYMIKDGKFVPFQRAS